MTLRQLYEKVRKLVPAHAIVIARQSIESFRSSPGYELYIRYPNDELQLYPYNWSDSFPTKRALLKDLKNRLAHPLPLEREESKEPEEE